MYQSRRNNQTNKKRLDNNKNRCTLRLPFISDSLIRKINYRIRKYNLDINFISLGNNKLRNVLKRKDFAKHDNCNLCKKLPMKSKCDTSCVVYQFTCNFCNAAYIGKTARPFYVRYREHVNSINKQNKVSALSEHIAECTDCTGIDSFTIEFLKRVNDPIAVSLMECRFIDSRKPALNRRHEAVATRLHFM